MTSSIQLHDLLARRWSPRGFAAREVSSEALAALFEAARWAPSCYNDQPWHFIIGRRGHGGAYDKLLASLVPFNQQWAVTAPVLMIGVVRDVFAHNGKPNQHAAYDLGLAMGNLLVQATALELYVHQMAGFDAAQAAAAVAVPADHSAVVAAALGYLGNAQELPADQEEKDPAQRERKPHSEFVFENTWGQGLG